MSTSVAETRSIAQIAFADLESEFAATRRVIERVPEDKFVWKPHEKSYTLGALTAHVANLVGWQLMIVEGDGIDLATMPRDRLQLGKSEILAKFEDNVAQLRKAVAALSDADLARPWTLRFGERVVFTQPKSNVLRSAGINHMVHHRAQLGVYLRLLDVPVPPTYGPTADEQ
jgi:uncharacterized damage-inducible protein DinB